MSTDPVPDYLQMTGAERGIEAIKACHRGVRETLRRLVEDRDNEVAQRVESARLATFIELLAILRPDMSVDQIIAAAQRRIAAEAS